MAYNRFFYQIVNVWLAMEFMHNIDGLAQDYDKYIATTLELLQSCANPSICMSISNLY